MTLVSLSVLSLSLALVLSFTVTVPFTITSALGVATAPDLLRLLAVPVFAWVAIRDIETRRVSSHVWIPLSGLGALLLVWDGWIARQAGGFAWTHDFLVPVAIGLGFVVPIAYLFWWIGGFGGADAKALMVLALLFPVFPAYSVGSWTFPLEPSAVGAFSFTILTNAVLVGVVLPVVLAIRNGLAGRIAPVMVVGWPVRWDRIPETHGRLLQTPDGVTLSFSGRGLDLDALRMYLRWRGRSLADVRSDPDHYRNPATLPAEPNPPTDGAVGAAPDATTDGGEAIETEGPLEEDAKVETEAGTETAVGAETEREAEYRSESELDLEFDDPWGAEAFLADIDGSAYGTSPEALREGLEVLCEEEAVWISPGMPFLVPVFLGLVIALVYGDLLLGVLF